MWWCVKSLNWSHLRHTRCSPVLSRHAGHLLIHVCQSWEMGTPVIWAQKKMSRKAAPLIPKHLWVLDPKLLKALAERVVRWRSACCLAKVFNSIFQNRTEDIQQELVVDKIGRAISFGEVLWFHGNVRKHGSIPEYRAAPHSSMRGCQCICHCLLFAKRFHGASVCSQTWEILLTMDAQPDIPMLNVTPDIVQSHVCFRIKLQPFFTGKSGEIFSLLSSNVLFLLLGLCRFMQITRIDHL